MSAAELHEFDEFEDDLFEDEETGETPRAARTSPVGALVLGLALIIAVYLEIALAIDARVLGAVPDLAAIVIVAIAVRFGASWGAIAGFVAGLLLDVAVQTPLGASALVLTPVGWIAGVWAERRRRVSLGMAIAMLMVATLAIIVGDVIVTIAIEGQDVAWGTFAARALAGLAFTVLLGILLLPLLRRVAGVPERDRA